MMLVGSLPPLVVLTVVSLIAAVGILLTMRATSNQARLMAVRRKLRACVYELRLFRDDLHTIGRIVAEGIRLNLTALRLALVPALLLVVPFALLAGQLQSVYGYAGLDVGQTATVSVRLKENAAAGERPRLVVPSAGLRVETAAVWIPSLREAAWRVAADRPGQYDATIEYRGESAVKRVVVSGAPGPRSPLRGSGFFNRLLYPAEPMLPAASAFESIAVTYPPQSVSVLGREMHWAVPFLVLSSIFVLALRRRFGVTL
jgi:hypothetical protein